MGMPEIPEGKHRPSLEETVVDLLESIALEEMAIAHLLNAEGERIQALVKGYGSQQVSYRQMQMGCDDCRSMVNSLIMKEWLLFNKLTTVLHLEQSPWSAPSDPTPTNAPTPPCHPCPPLEEDGLIRVPTTLKNPCKPRTL